MRDGTDALIGLGLPSAYTKQSGSKEFPGDPSSMVRAPRAEPWGWGPINPIPEQGSFPRR